MLRFANIFRPSLDLPRLNDTMAIRKNKPWLHSRFFDRQRLSTILKKIKEYNYYTKLQKGLKVMYSHKIDKRLTQEVITELMDVNKILSI